MNLSGKNYQLNNRFDIWLIMNIKILMLLACLTIGNATLAESPTTSSPQKKVEYLDIKHKQNIRIAFQVSSGEMKHGANKGLHYVKHIMDHYTKNGISDSNVNISAVLYGEASSAFLTSEALTKSRGKESTNPNIALIKALQSRGVSMELCGESKKIRKIEDSDLLPGVKVVTGAYARIVDLQHDGYSYIRFM